MKTQDGSLGEINLSEISESEILAMEREAELALMEIESKIALSE